jgi:ABC-type multidrug transport system ATPase subunit/CubicO group peptidase (beta-lactamase class C family)
MLRCILSVFFIVTNVFAQNPSRMDQIVRSYVSKKQFMGSALVARGDKILFSKGYGFANLEQQIPNTPATEFRIGSITKQFTAAAILLLEEQGKLKIKNPIKDYISDVPAAWDRITIYHLLTNTAGIPNYTDFPEALKMAGVPQTPEQLIALFRNKPLEFIPGTRWAYSNSGYVLLGYVIEKVSGQRYEDFIQQNILKPLGMENSGCDFDSDLITRRANGYSTDGTGPVPYVHMSFPYSAGTLYSTTGDLLRWEQGLFSGRLLSAASMAKMTKPYLNGYAFGLEVKSVNGRKQIAHGGSLSGFNAYLAYFPDSKITVAVLANLNGPAPEEIADLLADMAHGGRVILPSELKVIDISTGVLVLFAGAFCFIRRSRNRPPKVEQMPVHGFAEPAIDIRDLSFSYGSLKVLHGISFSVRHGEMVGLLGPNGAGKTTIIKILAGIQTALRGKVHMAGYVLPERHLDSKKITGYMPESTLMYECLSGMEFLELMGRLQGLDEKVLSSRVCALLEAFDMYNPRVSRISGYSKGMRQKILMCAALLHDPEIILLDEPLSGLDVDSCIFIKDLLKTLCDNGKTILYCSHILDVVEKVCDRIIVIDKGNILADAPLDELKSRTGEESLERIFRKLTHSESTGPRIARVMEALKI